MTRTEDRLRDAFDAAAASIPDGSLTPLTVPARRRRRPWTAPVAVAAGLAAVVIGGTAVGGAIPRASHGGPVAAGAGGPRHVLAIRDGRAVVENATAQGLTKAASLGGRYEAVAATGDGRTFFLAGKAHGDSYAFYRLTLDADGTPSKPERVPGGTVRLDSGFGKPENLAASPDGSRLAVVGTAGGRSEAVVIDVRTGGHRTWSATGGSVTGATWAPDNRTLGFVQTPGDPPDGAVLRLLDTARPGADLLSARVLRPAEVTGTRVNGLINVFVLNPDGRTATAQIQGAKHGPHDDASFLLATLSAADGRPTGRTVRLPSDSFFVKADGSGRHFLQLIDGRPGRVDGDAFAWLSRAADYDDLAW
ncbi:hypothetical protein [Actinomadura nitritigenes]|uniref:hypothetical protein n=1 Tax=Actinomadura nitritigenes TaxID=134602 RepID=UPI003D939F6F